MTATATQVGLIFLRIMVPESTQRSTHAVNRARVLLFKKVARVDSVSLLFDEARARGWLVGDGDNRQPTTWLRCEPRLAHSVCSNDGVLATSIERSVRSEDTSALAGLSPLYGVVYLIGFATRLPPSMRSQSASAPVCQCGLCCCDT
jgi:hypothetical protein